MIKCTLALFELEKDKGNNIPQRVIVECGGKIEPIHKTKHTQSHTHYCTKCGVRYEKLPEVK